MNKVSILTFLHGLLGFSTVAIASVLSAITLVISLLLPFNTWICLALIALPCVVFASWFIKVVLYKQLNRKNSPFFFYAALAMNLVFLCVAIITVRYIQTKGLSVGNMVSGLHKSYRLKYKDSFGLLADRGHKEKILQNYWEMKVLGPLFPAKGKHHGRVLNYQVNTYDFESLKFLWEEIFLRQEYYFVTDFTKPFVIDCGSHIGMSVMYFKALYPDAQILAFEPAPDHFRLLKMNIEQNALEDVTLVNKALANKEGTMKFYGDDWAIANLFENTRSGPNATDVEVTRLSKYVNQSVDFLKMDIEGAEDMVLEDLVAADKLRLVKQMVIEYHHHLKKKVDSLSKFLKALEENNFGYQIEAGYSQPYDKMVFQDIMIYAYQKQLPDTGKQE
jgi:FkbM family methyltransferase